MRPFARVSDAQSSCRSPTGQPSKKPLLTEIYDEFVFVEPNEQLAARLLQAPVPVGPPSDPAMNEYQCRSSSAHPRPLGNVLTVPPQTTWTR